MSAEHRICWVLVCDGCRTELYDPDGEFVPHFDTEDTALAYALDRGWRIDTVGALFCDRCIALALCVADGHDYTPWLPCACQGSHPDHALWGCGLLRYCQRTGCDHAESATLASLPTTDEPTSFGR